MSSRGKRSKTVKRTLQRRRLRRALVGSDLSGLGHGKAGRLMGTHGARKTRR